MKKDTILVVDDIETNRIILEDILEDKYNIVQAESGIAAVSLMFSAAVSPSIVLLDIMMPEMDGYEVLEMMKGNPLTEKIPVLFITAADSETNETKGLSLGAVDYISKPFNPEVVKVRVDNHLKLRSYSEGLEEMVKIKVAELVRTKEKILETMANIIEYRDMESGQHVKRTSDLTKVLVDYLFMNDNYDRSIDALDHDIIIKAVPLHDIGKISIPDSILLKPGPLTKEEFEIIKTHAAIGSEIVKSMLDEDDEQYLKYCYDICRYHHERWDGKGYPDGLAGEDIPLSARILAVVDVYDALVSARVYKPPFTHEKAIEIIKSGSGTQFDPEIVLALGDVQDQFQKVHMGSL
ncbi:MAG: response regulator [Clostridiales bacterium]|jgi:putative two-component system response regulator|nr:response regulator [Clostridiales bacterium]